MRLIDSDDWNKSEVDNDGREFVVTESVFSERGNDPLAEQERHKNVMNKAKCFFFI